MSALADATARAAQQREAALSPAEQRARGIVPTPLEVARRGIARLDALLTDELGLAGGLANPRVVVVDPAVGTGVWLAALLEHTRARGGAAHLIGIDLDPAALALAGELLRPEAAAQGTALELSCANALELASGFPPGDAVRVIVGNPPWAARSLSRGGALSDRWLAEFRRDDTGAPLGERRAGVLSDDYVRFFRWALEQARAGASGAAVCFATNASFLDGPVHRGMRAALLRAFDRLELLDLGGNLLLSRPAERDENVFGVRVGAALSWAVRRPGSAARAIVSYARVLGTRSEKLAALGGPLSLEPCAPHAPWFLLRPAPLSERPHGFSLPEAFPFHREGIQTNRDAIAIAATRAELEARIVSLVRGELALPARRHFDPVHARRVLASALERGARVIEPLAYRPLDDRFFLALAPLCHRPRPELLRAVAHSELCLLTVRKERGAAAFNLFAPAWLPADACFLSTRSSCRTRVFPSHDPEGAPNLAPAVQEGLAARLGHPPDSAELIAYALGVLGSPRFRARHEQALKLDYAQLPWPADAQGFAHTVAAGRAFVAALRADAAPGRVALVPGVAAGDPLDPEALRYDADSGVVSSAGQPLLRDVAPAWWAAAVGQQRLAAHRSAAACVGALAANVERAARWSDAEALADLAHGS